MWRQFGYWLFHIFFFFRILVFAFGGREKTSINSVVSCILRNFWLCICFLCILYVCFYGSFICLTNVFYNNLNCVFGIEICMCLIFLNWSTVSPIFIYSMLYFLRELKTSNCMSKTKIWVIWDTDMT